MDDFDVYGFIESRDRLIGDIPQELMDRFPHHLKKSHMYGAKEFNGELVFSMVSRKYFKGIESEFGKCDYNNPDNRKNRIVNIINNFGDGQHIYMGHIWFDIDTNLGNYIRAGLLPSLWFNIELSEEKGYPFLRTKDGDLNSENVDTLFISKIIPIENKILGRLIEIFSLNHIPDLQLFHDEGGRNLSPVPSAPPMNPEGKKNKFIYIEEAEDEFGELGHSIGAMKKLCKINRFKKNKRSVDITMFSKSTSEKDTINSINNNEFLSQLTTSTLNN